MRYLSSLASLSALVWLAGCSYTASAEPPERETRSVFTTPCQINDVTLILANQEWVDNLCATAPGHIQILDDGTVETPGTKDRGCSYKKSRKIIFQDETKNIAHEVRHILNDWCPKLTISPAANPPDAVPGKPGGT